MNTIIRVAFGVKADSMANSGDPVVNNARQLFSTNMGIKTMLAISMMFYTPGLAKLFNVRFKASVVDFFGQFSLSIIKQKRKLFETGEQIGKANNFIELLLEAEAEYRLLEQQETNTDKIYKCKSLILLLFLDQIF